MFIKNQYNIYINKYWYFSNSVNKNEILIVDFDVKSITSTSKLAKLKMI